MSDAHTLELAQVAASLAAGSVAPWGQTGHAAPGPDSEQEGGALNSCESPTPLLLSTEPVFLPDIGLKFVAPNPTFLLGKTGETLDTWRFANAEAQVEIARRELFIADRLLETYRAQFVAAWVEQGFELVAESGAEPPLRFDLRRSDGQELSIILIAQQNDVVAIQATGTGLRESALLEFLGRALVSEPGWSIENGVIHILDAPIGFEVPEGWHALPETCGVGPCPLTSIQLIGPCSGGMLLQRITIRISAAGAPETRAVVATMKQKVEADGISLLETTEVGRFQGVPSIRYMISSSVQVKSAPVAVVRHGLLLRTADHRIVSIDVAGPAADFDEARWNALIGGLRLAR